MLMSQIILDPNIYPRQSVNHAHVGDLYNALLAGGRFPALIVERKSKRLVDGWHRFHAYERFAEHEVEVEEREYESEEELWLDSVRCNSSHGLKYSTYDRTRILLEGERRGIQRERITELIHISIESAEKRIETRTAFVKTPTGERERVALRTSIKPLAGHVLTKNQIEVNKHYGQPGGHLLTQLNALLDAGFLTWATENDMAGLKELKKKLIKLLP